MKDELLTIQQAAALLGVSTKTLRRWEAKGHLTPQRTIGNQRRYSKAELTTFFQDANGKAKLQNLSTPEQHQQQITEVYAEAVPVDFSEERNSSEESPIDILDDGDKKHARPFRGILFAGAVFAIALCIGVMSMLISNQQELQKGLGFFSGKTSSEIVSQHVLGANDAVSAFQLNVNVPGMFGKKVKFLDAVSIKKSLQVGGIASLSGGIITNNANINAGKGKLTASNVIYSLVAGANITISGNKQNPTISAGTTGVSSLEGVTGDVSLTNGSGISLNGLQINNSGVLTVQGQSGDVTFTGGGGIDITGTTITNTDTGSAQNIFKTFTVDDGTDIAADNNNDTINFAAGSGISLAGDAGSKTITITSLGGGGGLSGLTTNGVLYATSPTTASSVVGTNGTVLHGVTGGAPVFGAVDLTSDVANILPLANGGTGVGSTPTNGQILIGNGSGYQLGTITQGSGIGIANGSGTITLTNSGVLSLTGTANQVLVNGGTVSQTGAIALTLPQDIANTSTPTFASAILSSNTNQLTLGTGSTGTISLDTLTGNRTYTFPDESGDVCLTSGNCTGTGGSLSGSGNTNFIPKFTSSSGVGDSSIFDNGKIGIGTTSPEGLFSVSGTAPGFALTELNQTGSGDILTGSTSGATRFVFDNSGNLSIAGGFSSGGTAGLTEGTASCVTTSGGIVTGIGTCQLGSEQWVVSNGAIYTGNPSLDLLLGGTATASAKIGLLNVSGGTPTASISANNGNNATYLSGDGTLGTTNSQTLTIGSPSTGNIVLSPLNGSGLVQVNGNVAISGTTGLTASGNGAGVSFSGTGNHIVSASSGTLELGAATLTGAIAGGGQNITGLGTINGLAITANTGTITTGTWHGTAIGAQFGGTGIDTSGATGVPVISGGTWTVDTNALAATHGGTGQTGYAIGDLLYADTTTTLAKRAIGSNGQILTVSGGVPVWSSAGGTINFWQENLGALAPINLTDDLLLGSTATGSAKFRASGTTGDLSATGAITFSGLGTGVVQSNSGLLSTGAVTNGELQNSSITVTGGTGLGVSGSPVALGGTLTLSNTGVTSAIAGTGISVSGGTGPVTITNAGVTSLVGGTSGSAITGALTISNSTSATSTITLDKATTTTLGIASFSSSNFSVSSGAVSISTGGVGPTELASTAVTANTYGGATNGVGQFTVDADGRITAASNRAIDLSTADVTGSLGTAKGGTGADLSGASQYSVPYFSATGVLGGALAPSTDGFVLATHGASSAPTWVSATSLGTNFWQSNAGVVSPLNITNDLAIGGTATGSALFQVSGTTGNLKSSGTVTFSGLGTGVVQSTSGLLSIGAVTNGELQNSSITVTGGTGLGVSGSPVALGGTLTLSNTGVTSAIAGTGISLSGGTGPVTITNAGVTSLVGGTSGSAITGALTISNSTSATSTITLDKATTTTLGIASFSSSNFSVSSGAVSISTGGVGPTELASTTVTANPYGGAGNGVGQFTVDADGRLTAASNRAIDLGTADITGTLSVGHGGTGTATSFTQGSVVFAGASGVYSQDNSNLFYNATNGLLGLGTNAPVSRLDVEGAIAGKALSIFNYTGTDQNILVASKSGTEEFAVNNNGSLQFTGGSGFLQTLTSNAAAAKTYNLPTFAGSSADICLNTGNCAGSGGGITGSGNATQLAFFTGTGAISSDATLNFDNTNKLLGIGTASPTAPLQVNGAYGSNAAAIINQLNSGNIFTASASGATEFNVTNNGSIQFNGGSGFLQTLTSNAAAGKTYNFPTFAGSSADICLNTGNCAGSGGGITGSGNATQLAFFTGTGAISSDASLNFDNTNKLLGIGTASPKAQLQVTGAYGGNAAEIVNQLNTADIFTASASGVTKFTLANDGTLTDVKYGAGIAQFNSSGVLSSSAVNLGTIGSSYITGTLPVGNGGTGVASFGGTNTLLYTTSANTLASLTTVNNSALITNGSGVPSWTSATANQVLRADGSGNVGFGSIDLSQSGTVGVSLLGVANGGSGLGTVAAGSLLYGTGTSPLSTLSITGSSGECLISNGSAPTWQACPGGGTQQYWQLNNGALSPINVTNDLLLGATATTSAKFAFTGNGGGTPTASVSAGVSGGVYLNALGTLATTAKQSLTLGDANTGNIVLTPGGTTALTALTNGNLVGNGTLTGLTGLSSSGTVNFSGLGVSAFVVTDGSKNLTTSANAATSSELASILSDETGTGVAVFGTAPTFTTSIDSGSGTFGLFATPTTINFGTAATALNVGASGGTITVGNGGSSTFTTSTNGNLTLTAAGSGNLTLSSDSNSSVFVGNATTPAPLSVSGGIGNNGAFILNQTNSGDLIDASASGALAFQVTHAGVLNLAGGQTSDLDTLSATTLTIGGTTQTGLTLGRAGAATTINGSSLTIGPTSWTATPTISGLITAANGLTINSGKNLTLAGLNSNNNSVLYTDASGVVNAAVTTTSGLCLLSNGSNAAPSWQACPGGGTQQYWQLNAGALSPANSTNDLLLGGTATNSAKFAFINNATGTPTASISANNGNNATYLTGAGFLGTTNRQTLTLGNSSSFNTTGNILINPNGTGSVEIGSTTAQAGSTLDVTGILAVDGNVGGLNLYSRDNSGADAQLFSSTLGDLEFYLNNNTRAYLSNTGRFAIGLNNTSPLASLDVQGTSIGGGIIPVASFSGSTSFANTLIDQSGSGDIFTASKSGASKFTVLNNGNVQINNLAAGVVQSNSSGILSSSALNLAGGASLISGQLPVANGGTGQDFSSAATGSLPYFSGTGVMSTLAVGTPGQVLEVSGGNIPSWVSTSSLNFFQRNANAISPLNITDDLLLGGTSTASAKFAFINNAGGTPTASISAQTGPGSTGLALSGNGSIQSLSNNTLTFGGGTTGNISFQPGGISAGSSLYLASNGNVGVGTTAPGYNLGVIGSLGVSNSSGTSNFNVTTSASGSFPRTLFEGGHSLSDSNWIMRFADSFSNSGQSITAGFQISSNNDASYTNTESLNVTQSSSLTAFESIFGASSNGTPIEFTTNGSSLTTPNLYLDTVANSYRIGIGTTSPVAQLDVRDQSGTTPVASLSGATSFAGLVVDNSGAGDLFAASSAGKTKYLIANNGSLQVSGGQTSDIDTLSGTTLKIGTGTQTGLTLGRSGAGTIINGSSLTLGGFTTAGGLLFTNGTGVVSQTAGGTSSQCLLGGTTPTWGSCALGSNLLQENLGALSPANITDDFLLGGTATASARFAFTNNIGAGTPTASISANSGSNATFLTGLGVLGTTNAQTLQIGSASTGNISLVSAGSTGLTVTGSGKVGIGTTAPGASLQVTGTTTLGGVNSAGALAVKDGSSHVIFSVDTNTQSVGIQTFTNATNAFKLFNASSFALLTGDTINNEIGIGTGSNALLATLDLRGTSGTAPVASFSGATTFANTLIDQSGTGDLFTASKSGATKFVIANNGNVGIGTAIPVNKLDIAGTAGVITQMTTLDNTSSSFASLQVQADNPVLRMTVHGSARVISRYGLTLGGWGEITLDKATSNPNGLVIGTQQAVPLVFGTNNLERLRIDGSGNVGIGTTTPLATLDLRGNSGTTPVASVSGKTTNAGLIVDNGGSGDIFTASASGATKFTILNNGNVQINNLAAGVVQSSSTGLLSSSALNLAGGASLISGILPSANGGTGADLHTAAQGAIPYFSSTGVMSALAAGSTGQCLTSGGTAANPTWSTCAAGSNLFQLNAGAISPANITNDLLIGGTSTASARFAFINNIGSGTPIASISANSGNNATYITGAGAIQTTNAQSLTLNGNGIGNVGVGTASPQTTLDVNGQLSLENGNANNDGVINLANTKGLVIQNQATATFRLLPFSGDIYFENTNTAGNIYYTGNNGTALGGNVNFLTSGSVYIGANSTSPLATLDLRGNSGITSIASISGKTSFAGLVVDQSGSGDIFTASSSGLSRFTITQAGDVDLGLAEVNTNAAKQNFSSSFTGNLVTNGSIQIGDKQQGRGNVVISPSNSGTGVISFFATSQNNDGQITSGDTVPFDIGANNANYIELDGGFNGTDTQVGIDTPSTPLSTLDVRANTSNGGTLSVASVSGKTSFAGLVVDNSGSGDLFTASKSGATKFVIQNNGNVGIAAGQAIDTLTAGSLGIGTTNANALTLGNASAVTTAVGGLTVSSGKNLTLAGITGNNQVLFATNGTGVAAGVTATSTANQCLLSGASTPIWGSCSLGSNLLQENLGALSPAHITDDLLLGGTSTASAKFAFINNIGAGTPTASISATTGSTYLTGAGVLGTTNDQTLQLGDTPTGNVALAPGGTAMLTASPTGITLPYTSGLANAFSVNISGAVGFNISTAGNTIVAQIGSGSCTSPGGATAKLCETESIANPSSFNIVTQNLTSKLTGTSTGTSTVYNDISDLTDTSTGGSNIFYGFYADGTGTTNTNTSIDSVFAKVNSGQSGNFMQFVNGAATELQLTNAGSLSLGTNTPLATLDVRGNSGTTPVASVSGKTTNAGLIVDNGGSGDIFTASASGATRLKLTNGGSLQLVGGQTSDIDTLSGVGLTIGATNANALSFGHGSIATAFTGTGSFTIGGNLVLNSSSATTTFGGHAYNWSGATPGSGFILETDSSGNLTWVAPGTLPSSNFWNQINGVLTPDIETQDLLLGSTATASADFAVTGINTTTPVASISAFNNAGNKNGIALNASLSTIQSFNRKTLTLGGNTTGDIAFQPGGQSVGSSLYLASNGRVGVGTVAPFSQFDVNGNSDIYGGISIDGNTSNNGAFTQATDLLFGGGNSGEGIGSDRSGSVNLFGLDFFTNSTLRMSVTNGGSVGIGTAVTGNAELVVNQPLATGDLFSASASGVTKFTISNNGRVGIGTTSPVATLDVRGNSATTPAASVSAASNFAALVVNNSGTGDLFTASKSGATKFTIQNSGVVTIGNNTNGISFDPTLLTNPSGQIYFGTARPTKQIVLSPEFAGAVLTASNSANTNGFMTSDASPSASSSTYNFENYYQWSSTQTSGLQDYTVAVRVTLPKDFSGWATSNAVQVDLNTNLKDTASNKMDVVIYDPAVSASTPILYDQTQASSVDNTWTTRSYAGSLLSSWSQTNPTAVLYFRMYAKNGLFVQLGDIKLNYLSAF